MTITPDQQLARQSGIGSSDSAAAINMNPYCTPVDLWLEKTGRKLPFAGNRKTHWGTVLEAPIRQEYAERTGRIVRLPVETLHHPTLPFVLCHPDGLTDDNRLYEGKNTEFSFGYGEPGSDQIPEQHLIQVQHAMLVCGVPVADLAVLIAGCDFRLYEIPADRELQEAILDAEVVFWQHVERDEPPAPDLDAPGALAVLRRLYPGTDGRTLQADEAACNWRRVFDEANVKADTYTAAADAAKAHLVYQMTTAAKLRFPDGRILRRQLVKRKGYTVEPTQFVDVRFMNDAKEQAA